MMEHLQENKITIGDSTDEPQFDSSTPTQAISVGRSLREARERLGLSVEDVVAKIKLAPRQIAAMEADDFQSLPETVFLRGFVRSYARLLQMDAQPLLDALPGAKVIQKKADQLQVETPFPTARSMRQQNVNLLIAAFVLALVIAGFAIWPTNAPQQVSTGQTETVPQDALVATQLTLPEQIEIMPGSGVPASEIPGSGVSGSVETGAVETGAVATGAIVSGAPTVQVAASSVVSATAPVITTLRLVFDKGAWAEIKDQSGKTLSKQVNLRGSELRVEGVAPFALVIGHAASVRVYHRNKQVDLTHYIKADSDVARLTLE